MASTVHAGDVLASRYRMVDLLAETDGGWLWNAHDQLLHRPVAIHLITGDDPRADALLAAARRSASTTDRRNLRVLDCNRTERLCYVVNEWGHGTSLDVALDRNGPMSPSRAAWLVAEVADTVAVAHAAGATHGRLVPENVLIDENGEIRIIGFGVEAALHVLPGTEDDDVDSIAALLYATLTGKWPGRIPSVMPSAPREGGRHLRPRQVRAGIPRPLDRICDEVLNGVDPYASSLTAGLGSVLGQREHHDLRTAADLRDALTEFIGDHEPDLATHQVRPAPVEGMVPIERPWTPPADEPPLAPLPAFGSLAGAPVATGDSSRDGAGSGAAAVADVEETVVTSRPTAGTAGDVDGTAGTDGRDNSSDGDATSGTGTGTGTFTHALGATEAGLPVFAGDEVEWVRTHAVPSEPAPTPPAPEAKPLFAPEEESRARRERLAQHPGLNGHDRSSGTGNTGGTGGSGSTGGTGGSGAVGPHQPPRLPDDYWPWDSTSPGSVSTSGVIPVVPGAPVPGRNSMRLGIVVGLLALLLLGGVAAWQWGNHGERPDSATSIAPSEDPTPSVTETPGPITGLTATDLDPQGDPPEEYPEQAPLAVDDDPATFWGTQTYKEQFGPNGLKTGVGLVVDLGESHDVRQVQVSVLGGETAAQLFVSDEPVTDVDGLEPVGAASGTSLLTFPSEQPHTGRYVTVWLTKIPNQDGGFRGKVAEIDVFA